ncbi:MAG: hypothetical protein KDJ19_05135, partial [Hyphomicrobiaceae bacterium]|nr:hypothetical protein [Hyphomicrobiaceae bacterium]
RDLQERHGDYLDGNAFSLSLATASERSRTVRWTVPQSAFSPFYLARLRPLALQLGTIGQLPDRPDPFDNLAPASGDQYGHFCRYKHQ